MDKVLDAVKVSTGNDGDASKTFVQVEGKLGSGNAYLDRDAASGTLAAGTGLDVDLRGISTVFAGLSNAIDGIERSHLRGAHDRRRHLRRRVLARHGQDRARRRGERPDHDLPLRRAPGPARRRLREPGAEGLRLHRPTRRTRSASPASTSSTATSASKVPSSRSCCAPARPGSCSAATRHTTSTSAPPRSARCGSTCRPAIRARCRSTRGRCSSTSAARTAATRSACAPRRSISAASTA